MHQSSCSQCQRRKQRCDRKWPCSHCRNRNVSHLCKFISKALQTRSVEHDDRPKKAKSGLKSADAEKQLSVEIQGDLFHPILADRGHSKRPVPENELTIAILNVPPRYLCDSLVNNFVHNANYIYYSIYPPKFLVDYEQWWKEPRTHRSLAFTCLLLRVCAYSAQYVPEEIRVTIEMNLAESIMESSQRFHDAAQKLSGWIQAGSGLTNVQQLFLAAPWYKSECQFKDTWRALSAATREAQEIGLHNADDSPDLDAELRRRMWCLLCLWDFQVSAWLGRPLLINHEQYALSAPSCKLDENDEQMLPSPFMVNVLQYQLCQKLYRCRSFQDEPHGKLEAIETWLQQLPPAFAHDKRLPDRRPQWLHQHRLQLQAYAVKCKLDVLRPFLVNPAPSTSSFQKKTITTALEGVRLSRKLFDVMTVANSKAYIISCVGFESGATLAAAMIHGIVRDTLDRHNVLSAVTTALDLLLELSSSTRLGSTTYGILRRMTSSMPLNRYEDEIIAEACPSRDSQDYCSTMSRPFVDQECSEQGKPSQQSRGGSLNDKLDQTVSLGQPSAAPPLHSVLYEPSLSDFENTNFAGLEDVWDWQDLNLDAFENTFGTVHFRPGTIENSNMSNVMKDH